MRKHNYPETLSLSNYTPAVFLTIKQLFYCFVFCLGSAASLNAQVDVAPLAILSTTPTQNALNVAQGSAIAVTFNQDMDGATINAGTMVVTGNYTGTITGTYSTVGATATFTPTLPFKAGERISITLTTGVQSSAGAVMSSSYSWDFTAEVLGGSGTYAAKTDYVAGDGPYSVFAADLDGDGDADLAVANISSDNVSVLMNNGDGTYAAKTDYVAGDNPRSVFVADLDGDGDVDLATANWASDNVSVLLNNGDGTYAAKSDYVVGDGPRSVFVADLDGDGDADLAVANSNSDNISVLMNNGDGSYGFKTDYVTGDYTRSVFVADLDGDGDADLAVANFYSDNVSVLLNNGDGTYAAKSDYVVGTRPFSVFASDLDGDGDVDLAVANLYSDNVSVLLNNGDGTYAPKIDYVAGDYPVSVFAADLDGDGDADLAVANETGDNISVLLNNGDGTYAAKIDYVAGDGPGSVFAADLDGDGDADLAVANLNSDNVSVLLNDWVPAATILSTTPTQNALNVAQGSAITATFNQDMDGGTINAGTMVVTGNYTGTITGTYSTVGGTATFTPGSQFKVGERISITLTSGVQSSAGAAMSSSYSWDFTAEVLGGSGIFSAKTDYVAGDAAWSVFASDLDGDGDADLAVANYYGNNVSVLLNNGDGTYAPKTDYAVGSYPYSVFASDLDGDGDADLVVANYWSDNVSVLLNNGDGSYGFKTDYAAGDGARSVFASDLDGDGDADLAVANYNSDNVSVLLNNGDGSYAPKTDYMAGDGPYSVFASDLDGDGDADLAVANYYGNNVSVLLNNGDGTYAAKTDYVAGDSPRSVFASDLDGDGDADLAVANHWSDNVSVLLNNGDGSYAPKTDYAAGDGPFSVFASDLDGDSDADLAVANYTSDNVSVLLNNGDGSYAPKTDYMAGDGPYSVFASDLDGDGDVDLAVANYTSDNVSVLLNLSREADLVLSSSTLSFGSIKIGATDTLAYKVFNHGLDSTLQVTGITSSNAVFVANPGSFSVLPGDSTPVTVTFTATTMATYTDSLTISSNDPQNPTVKVYVTGDSPPPAIATVASTIGFGSVKIGQGSTDSLRIVNTSGTNDLSVSNIASSNAVYVVGQATGTIAPGDTLAIGITFTPTTMVAYSDSLTISSNDPLNPTTKVYVTGDSPPPAIATVASTIGFGNLRIGQSATDSLRIINTSSTNDLSVSGITSSNAVFVVGQATGTIAPGDTLAIGITFTPTTMVAYSDSLTISSNDPLNPTTKVYVTGDSPPPAIATIASTIGFGSVKIGQSATDSLRIVNTSGTNDLSVSGITSSNAVFVVGQATGTVAPGDTLAIAVTYTPVDTVAYSDTLTISSNDPINPAYVVRIFGGWQDAPPVAINDTITIAEDSLAVLKVVENDTDADGQTVVISGILDTLHASVTIQTDSTLSYLPDRDFWGADSFRYVITDGFSGYDTATVYVTINSVNDVPTVTSAPTATATEDIAFAYTVTGFDVDGDTLTVGAYEMPTWLTLDADTLRGTPLEGDGDAQLQVWVVDASLDTAFLEVTITVAPVNDRPLAFALLLPTQQDTIAGGVDTLAFSWNRAVDVDSPELSYALTITGMGVDTAITTTDTVVVFRDVSIFANEQVYHWDVEVSDGELTTACVDTFEFVWPAALALDPFAALPDEFALHQNYPNPFNPSTTIRFDLPEQSQVHLIIYDMMGREVLRLAEGAKQAGYHRVRWDGKDVAGRQVASGIYFARLVTSEYSKVRKMLLLK